MTRSFEYTDHAICGYCQDRHGKGGIVLDEDSDTVYGGYCVEFEICANCLERFARSARAFRTYKLATYSAIMRPEYLLPAGPPEVQKENT